MMMKTLAAAAVAAALALPGMAGAQSLPPTKFNVVGSIGNLSMYTAKEVPFWNERIPKESGGAIQAQLKSFTELGFKGPEIFRLVSQGTLQMAGTVLNYVSGEVAIVEGPDLVGLVGSVDELVKAVDAFRPVLSREFETRHGIKLLGFGSYQAQVMYCRAAFKTLADLKGRKIRASGASQQAFVSSLGAAPVTIAFAEVQPALSTGVVDCAITGALSGFRARWHESATHISPMPLNYGIVAFMANLAWWKTLPAPVQAFLEKEIKGLEAEIFAQAKAETDIGIACNTATPGCPEAAAPRPMTLVAVTEADTKLRRDSLQSVILPAFAQRCGAECVGRWNDTIGKALSITIK